MKLVSMALTALMLSACGTLGGAISGAGEDLGRAGNWIKNR
jgi:predicted small secreted protein